MRSSTAWPSTPASVPSAAMCANGEVVNTPLKSNRTASIVTRPDSCWLRTAQTAVERIRGPRCVVRIATTRWVVAVGDATVVDVRLVARPLAQLVPAGVVGLHHHSLADLPAFVGALG